jgi:uncharacterized protein YqjF (DUF2071 family)
MTEPHPALPPDPIERPISTQRWEKVSFIHWAYPARSVQRLIPAGLEVETFAGSAWVGMVPFVMKRVTLGACPAVPWLTTFPETNLRTYVRGPDGGVGVWFFSLDVSRLAAVVTARTWFRVPYMLAAMRVYEDRGSVHYACRRHLSPAFHRVTTTIGPPIAGDSLSSFLLNRWRAYTMSRQGIGVVQVAHESWPVRGAEVVDLDQSLTNAAGLPTPTDPPIAHYSPGVHARVGRPST